MKGSIASAAAALVAAATVAAPFAGPAAAKPIDSGHTHDVFDSDPYDCEGTPAIDHLDIHTNFRFNLRGSDAFPYYGESVHGSVVTTNLSTGGTFTNVFASSSTDHKITDNGDGTFTDVVHGQGGSRYYDQFGKLVLKDPGGIVYALVIDYGGTPGDPADDVVVDQYLIRPSTGHSDFSDRDFCEDVVTFTS
jgi:hypothetical protein